MNNITQWNRAGIAWREMSVVELLWMVHTDNIAYLAQNAPSRLRRYLTERKDFAMLAAWDQRQLKDEQPDGSE